MSPFLTVILQEYVLLFILAFMVQLPVLFPVFKDTYCAYFPEMFSILTNLRLELFQVILEDA